MGLRVGRAQAPVDLATRCTTAKLRKVPSLSARPRLKPRPLCGPRQPSPLSPVVPRHFPSWIPSPVQSPQIRFAIVILFCLTDCTYLCLRPAPEESLFPAPSALWRLRMLSVPDCKVLQRDLLGCARGAPARVGPPAASRWCSRRPPTPRARGGARLGGLSCGRAAAAAAGPGSGARRRLGRGAM